MPRPTAFWASALSMAVLGTLTGCTGPEVGDATTLVSSDAPVQPPPEDYWSQYVAVPGASASTTFGVTVCTQGPGVVEITDVRPKGTKGTDFALVGIRLVTFRKDKGSTLASDDFPPQARAGDVAHSVPGSTPSSCDDLQVSSEVQIGLRKTGPGGGGWAGAIVQYTVDGSESRSIVIPFRMLMCGSETERC